MPIFLGVVLIFGVIWKIYLKANPIKNSPLPIIKQGKKLYSF